MKFMTIKRAIEYLKMDRAAYAWENKPPLTDEDKEHLLAFDYAIHALEEYSKTFPYKFRVAIDPEIARVTDEKTIEEHARERLAEQIAELCKGKLKLEKDTCYWNDAGLFDNKPYPVYYGFVGFNWEPTPLTEVWNEHTQGR